MSSNSLSPKWFLWIVFLILAFTFLKNIFFKPAKKDIFEGSMIECLGEPSPEYVKYCDDRLKKEKQKERKLTPEEWLNN